MQAELGRNHAFLDQSPYGGPPMAPGLRALARAVEGAARLASREVSQQRAVSEQSSNGSDPSDSIRRHATFMAIVRSDQARLRRAHTRRTGPFTQRRGETTRDILDGFNGAPRFSPWRAHIPQICPMTDGIASERTFSIMERVSRWSGYGGRLEREASAAAGVFATLCFSCAAMVRLKLRRLASACNLTDGFGGDILLASARQSEEPAIWHMRFTRVFAIVQADVTWLAAR